MDKPNETPETIYLIPDSEHGHVWCDDPAPGMGMDPEEATEYRRADFADTALAAAEARIAELEEGLRDAFNEGWNSAVGCDFLGLDEEMRDKELQWSESDAAALLKEKE